MSGCPEWSQRAAMTDDEFWDHVFQANTTGTDVLHDLGLPLWEPDDDVPVSTPCPECGAAGACSWDAEGRPLIHAATTPEDT